MYRFCGVSRKPVHVVQAVSSKQRLWIEYDSDSKTRTSESLPARAIWYLLIDIDMIVGVMRVSYESAKKMVAQRQSISMTQLSLSDPRRAHEERSDVA